MGAMSASIKIRKPRQASCSRRTELSRKESDGFGSYHSHLHLMVEKTDLQRRKEKNISTSDSRVGRDGVFSKSVVFSSKTESKHIDAPRKQSSGCRTKTSSLQENKSEGRNSECSSKLIQTSSSITRVVSRRSIAIGVSDDNIGILEKYRSKPASKNQRSRRSSARPLPPDSGIAINSSSRASVPQSRTESSVMAALEAPLASYRHCRCMTNHSYSTSPNKVSPKKNAKSKAPPTVKRKPPKPHQN